MQNRFGLTEKHISKAPVRYRGLGSGRRQAVELEIKSRRSIIPAAFHSEKQFGVVVRQVRLGNVIFG